MFRMTASTIIRRPIEEVFAYFADGTNEPEYNGDYHSSEHLTEGPVRSGSRFHQKGKRADVIYEVTEHNPPHHWSFKLLKADIPVMVTGSHRFESVEDGTRVTWVYDAHPHGPLFRVLAPLLRPIAQRRNQRHLNKARTILERRAGPSSFPER